MLRMSGTVIRSARFHVLYPWISKRSNGRLGHGISGYLYESICFLTHWEQTMTNCLCDGCVVHFFRVAG